MSRLIITVTDLDSAHVSVWTALDSLELWNALNEHGEPCLGASPKFPAVKVTPREEAIEKFGIEVVKEAESYYGTDFNKHFWSDLNDKERHSYFYRANAYLDRRR